MNKTFIERFYRYLNKIWFLWLVCLTLNIITFLLIYYKIHPSNKTLALHYNVMVGVEWYGNGKNLYFLPGIGLVLTIVNFACYHALKGAQFFLRNLSIFITLILQFVLLAAALFLAKVN